MKVFVLFIKHKNIQKIQKMLDKTKTNPENISKGRWGNGVKQFGSVGVKGVKIRGIKMGILYHIKIGLKNRQTIRRLMEK